ncbi:sulfite reductase [Moraxella osloensis]|uniref:Sulfite reductase [ferredoxin] n=1 Tax=Faucicola osloensis TaxID=34062 RepID=A0A378QDR2_FAUOS|nr:nitrite/sulfite reductase [Moraxella osloensis]AME00632.1 sulfite reductase [Moraxella osloensis]OBX55722.1 sulfite reductase [Moraxella osloensis]QPT41772.1 nitrite/sulfite reductase [Moraxella osloensis]STY97357.1 Sulfite reductase [ferredoxin] [Moraxella osloensis]
MYKYNAIDQQLVDDRVEQFRDQTRRFLAGELSEEAYLPLRLMNGLYIQRHAPMLRVAIPYGLLATYQLRKLADISEKYDRGYGHITTRTNMQFNWPKLEEVPDILAELASVQMHAIQTSGNCIRNTTTDQFAGVTADEIADPRPYCEIIRQWSTFHPEFTYLPRKFKIAVIGTREDRAATQLHDIGLHVVKNDAGDIGFEVIVGGGLGRTPVIGKVIRPFLPERHLLSYLDAILRIYNQYGRRDNKYKARIKILVESMGAEAFSRIVEEDWEKYNKDGALTLTAEQIEHAKTYFPPPAYQTFTQQQLQASQDKLSAQFEDSEFVRWFNQNTREHKVKGYQVVIISLKHFMQDTGDITATQMRVVADLADKYSFGEVRGTHHQNLVLTDVKLEDVYEVYQVLKQYDLARPNIGLLTDIISCPGFDYCSLANASTLNIVNQVNQYFQDADFVHDIGEIRLNMSGCMNACAHHHVADIGILGVDKKGEHWYQISLGGRSGQNAKLGDILGKAVPVDAVAATVDDILQVYLKYRQAADTDFGSETFAEVVDRIGIEPFKEYVYRDKSEQPVEG